MEGAPENTPGVARSDAHASERPEPSTRRLVVWTSAIAVVTFLVLGAAQYIGMQTSASSYPRLRAPGAEQLPLSKGTVDVWIEKAKAFPIPPGSMTVQIYDPSGNELAINAQDAGKHYWTPRRTGDSVGSVAIPSDGLYLVVARGGGGNAVSVGRFDPTFARAWMIIWFVLAGISMVVLIVSGVTLRRERRGETGTTQTSTIS